MDGDSLVVTERFQGETSIDLGAQLAMIQKSYKWDCLVSTGYGRILAQNLLGGQVVTEIMAYTTSAHHFHKDITTVIDLGGQDTKALSINSQTGKLLKFEMNDKCSAGTGKFFEMMAATMGLSLAELAAAARRGGRSLEINSTCTVFAESEVISLLTSGASVDDISRAIHESLLNKLISLLSRVMRNDEGPVLFVGGGARNSTLVALLAEALGKDVVVPEYPEFFGAYGAALLAKKSHSKEIPCLD